MAGPAGNALNAVASSLNFTYTLTRASDYGVRLSNGSWTGMVGAVHRGEADAIMSMMTLTYERHSVLRFGPCIEVIDFTILSSASPNEFDAFGYIRAFDIEVWIAVFASLICLSCLVAIGEWKEMLIGRTKHASFLDCAYAHGWELFGLLFAESSPRRYVHASQKLLMVVWLLTVVVMGNSFGSLLKSKQAVSIFKPEVDSVDDLAARPYLTPVIPSRSYLETFARHSRSPSVKVVWERSRSRRAMPPISELFTDSVLEQVAAHRAVVLLDQGSILLQVTGFCERRNVRTFVVAGQPLESSPFGFMFSRSIDERFFRKLFDKYRRILETGLMSKWLADSKGNWQRCIQSRTIAVESISLDDTVPFFLLWGIMCAMAFCALLGELVCLRVLQRHHVKRR
ncbi:hypothetical protein MRX96_034710 [Rhipicephalus microplus]